MEYLNAYPKKRRGLYLLKAIFGICMSVALIAFLFFVVAEQCRDWMEFAVCFLLLLPWIMYGSASFVSFAAFTNERIRIDSSGLYVKYSIFPWKRMDWDAMKGVYLCHYIVSEKRCVYGWPVICCVKANEKEGLNGRWKMYRLFHLFSVVTIDDQEELRCAFEECSPLPIIDLRAKRDYRLREDQIIE